MSVSLQVSAVGRCPLMEVSLYNIILFFSNNYNAKNSFTMQLVNILRGSVRRIKTGCLSSRR